MAITYNSELIYFYLLFVELSKAYESNPNNAFWETVENKEIKKIYLNAIKTFYENNAILIKTRNYKEPFLVNKCH